MSQSLGSSEAYLGELRMEGELEGSMSCEVLGNCESSR